MKIINIIHILFALTVLSFHSCDKLEVEPELVEEFSMLSINTQTQYKIWVALPENYSTSVKHETIYVLDGDASYLKTEKIAAITTKLSAVYNKQNAVVIGISSNNRSRDFTPTETSYGEGGSENYSRFVEFELIPKIENDYAVDTAANARVLIGHSLGGLLSGYFFTKHPNVFGNYIMLSPSFWYDDYIFFNHEEALRATNSTRKNLVFIGCGQLEETIVLTAIEWDHRLSAFYPNCTKSFKVLKNRSHLSSALENAETGLEFYYKTK